MLISFREWLVVQRQDRGPIGEIAREVAGDACLPPQAHSYTLVKQHILSAHGASRDALEALRVAAATWEYTEPGSSDAA